MNRATAGGLAAIALWSGTVAVARSAAEAVGPLTAAAAVCGVGAVPAVLPLLRPGARRRAVLALPGRYLGVCGALFVAYLLLLFLAVGGAVDRQQTLTIGLLNYLWPPLTVVLAVPLLGRRAGPLLAPGLALALVGLALVVAQGGGVSWRALAGGVAAAPGPHLLAATAAVAWALHSTLTRRWAGGREAGAVGLFLPAAAAALTLAALLRDEPGRWTGRAAAEVLGLGVATWAAYTLWDGAMRRGDVALVAAASYLTPLLSTLVSALYLAVVPGAQLWVGCALLAAGSYLSWRSLGAEPARR